MKLFKITLILSLTFSLFSQSQSTKEVLFVGNSYTYYNNLPSLVNDMAVNTGDTFIYDVEAPGGQDFKNHESNPNVLNKINSSNWDFVVLQGHSRETSKPQADMELNTFPFVESLVDTVKENNLCSQPMFFMTWGRENGYAPDCPTYPWLCTYEGMDDVVKDTYIFMADEYNTKISPVGAVWRYIRTNFPSIDLYDPDESHPSLAGSYAAACTFYTMVYEKDPTLITWNSTLSTSEANNIKLAAKTIVFNQIANWDYTINPALADFSETINEKEVSFVNECENFDTLLWDFGDGNTSTITNPVHTYSGYGFYNVSLTVTICNQTDIKIKTIECDSTLNIEDFGENKLIVSPNPTSNSVTLKLSKNYKKVDTAIFDVTGKLLASKRIQNSVDFKMDISDFSAGLYILNVFADNDFYTTQIIKK